MSEDSKATVTASGSGLSGPEKAVLMLLSLEEGMAAPIVSELDAADLKRLREVAAEMRTVPAAALEEVYEEFVSKSGEAVAVPRGGVRYLRRLSTRALGEARADEIFMDAPPSALDRLAAAEPSALAAVLENEHPQLIAAMMSQIDADKGAMLIEMLPEPVRPEVLARLGTMTEVPGALLEDVATAISAELPSGDGGSAISVDGVARSAAVVRMLGKETCELLLGDLEESNEDLAAEIRRAMYSFDDLRLIDPKSLRELLKAVPGDRLTLALKTASEDLKTHLFSSMSKRAGDLIRDDLEMLGGVRLADVEAAQAEIVEIALRLEAEGTLSLGSDNDEVV